MRTLVLLLRAVNVGGSNLLPMAALRGLLEGLGYSDAATYLQSGNAVVTTHETAATVVSRVEAALAGIGLPVAVVVRDHAALAELLAQRPGGSDDPETGKRHHVAFLDREVPAEARSADLTRYAPDSVRLDGVHAFLHYPNGAGKAKLTSAVLERHWKVRLTARNWSTVEALFGLSKPRD